jgi:hypothetical protein
MYQNFGVLRKVSLIMGVALLLLGLLPGVLAGVPAVFAEGEEPVQEPLPAEDPVSEESEPATPDEPSDPALSGEPLAEELLVEPDSETLPTPEGQSSVEENFAVVVDLLAETGAVLVDGNNEPVSLTSNTAVSALGAGDPYFTRLGVTYYYLTDCTGYSNCTVSANPIQAAIDDVDTNGLPDDGTIYVLAGVYQENLIINVDNLTLFGDPGALTQAGTGANAPVLEGINIGGTGIFINGNGVSILGFVIQNFNYGILLNASGNKGFTAENNTFYGNSVAVYNKNAVPGVDLHYNIFNGNGLAIQNDDKRGLQFVDAQMNFWGCDDGPIVQYWDDDEDEWVYVLWATKLEIDPNDYQGCEFLYGENSKWDHQINTDDYSPFKINLGPLTDQEIPGCTDERAMNYNPEATSDDGSCEFDEEIEGCMDPGAVNYDPYATIDSEYCQFNLELSSVCLEVEGAYQIAWQIFNPNDFSVDVSFDLDGSNGATSVGSGSSFFVGYTDQGPATHTLNASWEFGDDSISNSEVCAPTITTDNPGDPGTPLFAAGGPLIPVTGADLYGQSLLSFGGVLLIGLSMLIKGLANKLNK